MLAGFDAHAALEHALDREPVVCGSHVECDRCNNNSTEVEERGNARWPWMASIYVASLLANASPQISTIMR
jgi:hypothetical protein